MKKASGDDSPSPAGCREEILDHSDLETTVAAACSMFRGKVFIPLGFSRQRKFIGGKAMSGGGPGGHTTLWRGQGVACATLWCGRLLTPLRLFFGLRLRVR
jgi:hypothetical protein